VTKTSAAPAAPFRGATRGDLRERLIAEAIGLASVGGPEAIVLREVARRAGVSATAAYRHFEDHDALRLEVKMHALQSLNAALRRPTRTGRGNGDAGAAAITRFRALGRAYVRWARANPGLFRTAFDHDAAPAGAAQVQVSLPARQALAEGVDALVAAGELAPADRPYSEEAAWSAVHGVALLLISGPLRHAPKRDQDGIVERVLEMAVGGLCHPDGDVVRRAPAPRPEPLRRR
jgi:AcrR family transcriptional regulator